MSKYLKSISFNCNLDFLNEKPVREIATLYLYLIGEIKINAGGFSQIILENSKDEAFEETGESFKCSHPFKYLNLLPNNSSDKDIKKFFVNEVTDILTSIGASRGWDIDKFEKIKEEIERREFKFYGFLGRAKSSEKKLKTAIIMWNTDDYINIGINIKNKTNNSEEWIRILRIGIGLGLFESVCGKIEWEGENKVKMYHSNKRDYWEVDVTNKEVSFHYIRAESGDPHGQYDFAKMYIDGWLVEKNLDMATKWLEKSAAQGFGRAAKLLGRIKLEGNELSDPIKNSLK